MLKTSQVHKDEKMHHLVFLKYPPLVKKLHSKPFSYSMQSVVLATNNIFLTFTFPLSPLQFHIVRLYIHNLSTYT